MGKKNIFDFWCVLGHPKDLYMKALTYKSNFVKGIRGIRVAQNTPKVKNDLFPHSLRFLGYHRWDICKKNQNSMKPSPAHWAWKFTRPPFWPKKRYPPRRVSNSLTKPNRPYLALLGQYLSLYLRIFFVGLKGGQVDFQGQCAGEGFMEFCCKAGRFEYNKAYIWE